MKILFLIAMLVAPRAVSPQAGITVSGRVNRSAAVPATAIERVVLAEANGTVAGETTISVGYSSLQLQLSLPKGELQTTSQFNSITISTKNMMDEFVKSMVTVRMYKLNAPDRLIRDRYWEQPDQFIMNEKEYRADFPYDEYNNETDKENWERGEKVYEKKDSSSTNGQWAIDNKQFSPGCYVI